MKVVIDKTKKETKENTDDRVEAYISTDQLGRMIKARVKNALQTSVIESQFRHLNISPKNWRIDDDFCGIKLVFRRNRRSMFDVFNRDILVLRTYQDYVFLEYYPPSEVYDAVLEEMKKVYKKVTVIKDLHDMENRNIYNHILAIYGDDKK